jgi:HJR/Mrr/RecB family endonuclease
MPSSDPINTLWANADTIAELKQLIYKIRIIDCYNSFTDFICFIVRMLDERSDLMQIDFIDKKMFSQPAQ